jgi:hypothetical protein
MNATRRRLVQMASIWPVSAMASKSADLTGVDSATDRLILSDFTPAEEYIVPGARWRGFTDRVMGGVSNAEFNRDMVSGKRCVRMTGNVTRDNGGGFVQMALYLNGADLSKYKGLELIVYGNDEDYNVHIRTSDCGWHDESYRATFHAESRWQTVRIPWNKFKPNGVTVDLNTAAVERVGLLGWMRDFTADLAIAEVALYT